MIDLNCLMIGMPGPLELLLILLIALLIFGAGRLTDLAKALGKSIKEFKKGFQEDSEAKSSSEEKKDK